MKRFENLLFEIDSDAYVKYMFFDGFDTSLLPSDAGSSSGGSSVL